MAKEKVHTEKAPKAVGPYSQAIRSGNLVFCSGQIPLDPSSMKMVEGDVQAQTRQVLENLKAVVEASGTTMDKVLKTTVLLADITDFVAVNEIYAQYFDPERTPPARAAYQVAALPLGARVEIEAIAAVS
jgi:2-iminobutanoate/2-iminopropanoate deaminase